MRRLTLVTVAVSTVLVLSASASAEIKDELAKELERYVETSMAEGGAEAQQAALLTWGLFADKGQTEKIAEKKSAKKPRVRFAAGLALWLAGAEDASRFVAEQAAKRSNFYRVLRRQVSVLPDDRERALLKELVAKTKPPQQKAIFRYLSFQHGSLYELLGSYLAADDDALRARALAAARHTARPAALQFVESHMLSSPDEKLQLDGVELAVRVSTLPGRKQKATQTLEKALDHANSKVVQKAAIRLLELHDESGVDPLVELLDKVDAVKRKKSIARALLANDVSLTPKQAKELYVSEVAPKKSSKESTENEGAKDDALAQLYLELAVASGDDGMFKKVKKMFGSTHFDRRLAAARAMGRTDRKSAVDMLGKALFEGNPKMRLNAAQSLRQIGTEQSLPALKRSISQERNKQVKLQVIRALGNIGTPDALRILRFNSRARDREIRKAIITAVREANREEGFETLRLYINARDREIQWKTFVALLDIAPKKAMKQMSGIFRNPPDRFIRDLEELSLERQTFIYRKLLRHDNGRVRKAAFESANRTGGPMYELLHDVAFDMEAPKDIRTSALRTFSEIRDDSDRSRFEKVARVTAHEEMRHLAAWTLTEYDSEDLEATFRGYVAQDAPLLKAIGAYGIARIYTKKGARETEG